MNSVKLVKKFLMPCGLCAVPIIKSSSPIEKDPPKPCSHDYDKTKLIRPSQLPIYIKDDTCSKKMPGLDQNCPPSYLEQGFGTVRRSMQGLVRQTSVYSDAFTSTIDTGVAHSQVALDYLREDANTLPRVGAVGIGGLTGLIFGLRGGKFKKFVYSSTGAITIASICYPRQAQQTLNAVKHYTNIGYNFVYGVKPDDVNQKEINWPDLSKFKVPTSFSEISNLAVNAGSTIVNSINSLIKNSTEQKENKSADEVVKSKEK